MATKPNQYQRPLTYDEQLQKQKNAAADKARKDKEKADKAKNQRELQSLKVQEAFKKDALEKAEKEYAAANKEYTDRKNAAILPGSPGGSTITQEEQTGVNSAKTSLDFKKLVLDRAKTSFAAINATRLAKEKDLNPPKVVLSKLILNKAIVNKKTTKATSQSSGVNTSTLLGIAAASGGSKGPSPLTYYYNAPMIKTSYLSAGASQDSPSPQQRTSNLSISGADNYGQGLDAWTGAAASKGVIQMDATSAFSIANSSTYNGQQYDGNLYGFKFLYNPKEVAMTWGVAEGQNWEGIAAGLEAGTAPSAALQNSTISFSLLLNRSNDLGYLDSNGLKAGVGNPYGTFAHTKPINEELAELYEKGTMYDMEYLFRTLTGLNSSSYSGFKGDTADQGWLQGFAVELHLGNRLRYLVRVTNVEVNHVIFDERMVPIVSYVNISCARFPYVKASN